MVGDGPSRPLRVLQRSRSDVDPPTAGRQREGQGVGVADPPGQLDLQIQSTDDVGDDLPVVATSEGGIEVDEVDPLGALVLPAFGGQPRVAELPARSGDALLKLHGTSLGDVDGGEELQAGRGGHWGFASGVGG